MQAMAFLTALRLVFSGSEPTADASTSWAIKNKVHPALWIFRSSSLASTFLTRLHPFRYGSLSNCRHSGKTAPSLIRIVPVLIFSSISFSPHLHWQCLSLRHPSVMMTTRPRSRRLCSPGSDLLSTARSAAPLHLRHRRYPHRPEPLSSRPRLLRVQLPRVGRSESGRSAQHRQDE